MDVNARIFNTLFNYIDFTAPSLEVNTNYTNLLAILQTNFIHFKNEVSELKQQNADLRFKNAELCEELFKLTRK